MRQQLELYKSGNMEAKVFIVNVGLRQESLSPLLFNMDGVKETNNSSSEVYVQKI